MMIHQQPPPKPPLLPQHMICHLTYNVPVTETGSDAALFGGTGAVPRLPFLTVTETGSDAALSGGAGAGLRPRFCIILCGRPEMSYCSRRVLPRRLARSFKE